MLGKISTPDLRKGLEEGRQRIDRLVADRVIEPEDAPARGVARLWSLEEAMRLAIVLALTDEGRLSPFSLAKLEPRVVMRDGARVLRTPSEALIYGLNKLRLRRFDEGGNGYLLVGHPQAFLIPTSKRGEPAPDRIPAGFHDLPEIKIVRPRELADEIAGYLAPTIIDLTAMEQRLLAFWPKGEAQ